MENREIELIKQAVAQAMKTMREGVGGPFGAAIIDPEGNVYVASNTVLGSSDPTAHAEVNAIRSACKAKGTHDLSGCILYTTCYPCPMCLGAIIWANIKTIYYGASPDDAASIGFRDDYIYKFIEDKCKDQSVLKINRIKDYSDCQKLFKVYAADNRDMY